MVGGGLKFYYRFQINLIGYFNIGLKTENPESLIYHNQVNDYVYHNTPIMDQTSTESSQSIEIVSGDRHQQLSQQVLLFRD